VNLDKTNIVGFRKGGKLKESLQFFYDNKPIEIVSSYTYLGVPFHSSGTFHKTAIRFYSKGIASLVSVWKIIRGGKVSRKYNFIILKESWESKKQYQIIWYVWNAVSANCG